MFTKQLALRRTNKGLSEKARGHKNHKNSGSGVAEQQLRPLLLSVGLGREEGRASLRISVNFRDLIFFFLACAN